VTEVQQSPRTPPPAGAHDWTGLDMFVNSHQTLKRAPCIEDVDVGDVVTLRDTELAPGERRLLGLSFSPAGGRAASLCCTDRLGGFGKKLLS